MKSTRAEEYIDDNIYDAAECVDKDGCGWAVVKRSDAYRAVELAEKDLINRAIVSYCENVCEDRPCDIHCQALDNFIKKLMEG